MSKPQDHLSFVKDLYFPLLVDSSRSILISTFKMYYGTLSENTKVGQILKFIKINCVLNSRNKRGFSREKFWHQDCRTWEKRLLEVIKNKPFFGQNVIRRRSYRTRIGPLQSASSNPGILLHLLYLLVCGYFIWMTTKLFCIGPSIYSCLVVLRRIDFWFYGVYLFCWMIFG